MKKCHFGKSVPPPISSLPVLEQEPVVVNSQLREAQSMNLFTYGDALLKVGLGSLMVSKVVAVQHAQKVAADSHIRVLSKNPLPYLQGLDHKLL